MSYDIHITRADHWIDSDNAPIAYEEYEEVIKNDSSFRVSLGPVTELDGLTIEHGDEPLYIWTYEGEDEAIFWYNSGRFFIPRAKEHIIEKMIDLANKLNAKVQGDDGEIYFLKDGEVAHRHE